MSGVDGKVGPKPPPKDRNGRIYKNRAEQMKYFMRRTRGSLLPQYPEYEPKSGER